MNELAGLSDFSDNFALALLLALDDKNVVARLEEEGDEFVEAARTTVKLYQNVSQWLLGKLDVLQAFESKDGFDKEAMEELYRILFVGAEMDEMEIEEAKAKPISHETCWFRYRGRAFGIVLDTTNEDLFGLHLVYADHAKVQNDFRVLSYFLFEGDWVFGPSIEDDEQARQTETGEIFRVSSIEPDDVDDHLDGMICAFLAGVASSKACS